MDCQLVVAAAAALPVPVVAVVGLSFVAVVSVWLPGTAVGVDGAPRCACICRLAMTSSTYGSLGDSSALDRVCRIHGEDPWWRDAGSWQASVWDCWERCDCGER